MKTRVIQIPELNLRLTIELLCASDVVDVHAEHSIVLHETLKNISIATGVSIDHIKNAGRANEKAVAARLFFIYYAYAAKVPFNVIDFFLCKRPTYSTRRLAHLRKVFDTSLDSLKPQQRRLLDRFLDTDARMRELNVI